MEKITFINDNSIEIFLPSHELSKSFSERINSELLFRKITTYMINNDIIKNNMIDAGSWIGDNSIPWAKNIEGIVYSIDPSATNLEFINLVKSVNNITNIITIQKGLSDKNKIISTNDDLFHCMFVSDDRGKTKIESNSLDYLYNIGEINNIGYIHLDVEGMESLVILGSENLINQYRPLICFEQHIDSDDYVSLSNGLKNKNYVVYLIDESFTGCKQDCRNLLAIPKEKLPKNFIKDVEIYLNVNNVLIEII